MGSNLYKYGIQRFTLKPFPLPLKFSSWCNQYQGKKIICTINTLGNMMSNVRELLLTTTLRSLKYHLFNWADIPKSKPNQKNKLYPCTEKCSHKFHSKMG